MEEKQLSNEAYQKIIDYLIDLTDTYSSNKDFDPGKNTLRYRLNKANSVLKILKKSLSEINKDTDECIKTLDFVNEEIDEAIILNQKKSQDYRNYFDSLSKDEQEIKKNEIIEEKELFVINIDIRNSTFYLENCFSPSTYSKLINSVNTKIIDSVDRHFGIIDNFLGDGFLIYFSEGYSGSDYIKLGLLCANEIINDIQQIFVDHEEGFKKFLFNNGVGVGVDIGLCNSIKIGTNATYMGNPVVNACRICSQSNNQILVSAVAYHKIIKDCTNFIINAERIECSFKNNQSILTYNLNINTEIVPNKPKWFKDRSNTPTSPKER